MFPLYQNLSFLKKKKISAELYFQLKIFNVKFKKKMQIHSFHCLSESIKNKGRNVQ